MANSHTLSRDTVSAAPLRRLKGGATTVRRPAPLPVTEAVTLHPEEPILRAIRLLNRTCFSALPVVDPEGKLIGLVTENHLLTRLQSRKRSWWATLFADPQALAREYRRAMGRVVSEVMGPPPIPIPADASVQVAADLLTRQGSRDLPVVADERVTGMVSAPDLLALLEVPEVGPADRTDAGLVAEMKNRLATEAWVSNRGLWVEAANGVLFLSGLVADEEEQRALETMARSIPGCVGVDNHTFPKTALRGRWM